MVIIAFEARVVILGLLLILITDQLIIATFACTYGSVYHIPFSTAIRQTYWDLKVGNTQDKSHDFANIPQYIVTSVVLPIHRLHTVVATPLSQTHCHSCTTWPVLLTASVLISPPPRSFRSAVSQVSSASS